MLLQEVADSYNVALKEKQLFDLSGLLQKTDKGDWEIIVNSDDAPTRKLFTIAHELGHYFLHKEEQDQFIDGGIISFARDEEKKGDQYEKEANEFAAQLLMPEQKISEFLSKRGNAISVALVQELASFLRLSTIAVATRLRNLGY